MPVLSNKWYERVKWTGIGILPAVTTLCIALYAAFPDLAVFDILSKIFPPLGVFILAIFGISSVGYYKEQSQSLQEELNILEETTKKGECNAREK